MKKTFKLNNFSIGQFNSDINNSHDPDEKHNRWAAYRSEIGRLLCGAWQSSVVLGAGALNDIDMHLLCRASEHVVLADIDAESVQKGLIRQKLSHKEAMKTEIVRCDFSGAQSAKLFERLEAAVKSNASAEEFAGALSTILLEMKPDQLLSGFSFDLVLSCPVYTQLVYTQIEVLLKILYASEQYSYDELHRILLAAHSSMKCVLRGYNKLMLSLLSPGGRLIVLSDIMELPSKDPRLQILAEQNKKGCINARLLQSLIEEQGNELAINALEEIESELESPEIRYFIWPFDDEKSFLVKGLSGRGR